MAEPSKAASLPRRGQETSTPLADANRPSANEFKYSGRTKRAGTRAETGSGTGAGKLPRAGQDPETVFAGQGSTGKVDKQAGTPDAPYGFKEDGTPYKRKPSKGGTRKATTKKGDIVGFEKTLLSLHGMAAGFFKAQQWRLGEDEAKEISRAIVEVQEQYEVNLDPKTQAWINLLFILAAAYGPRMYVTLEMAKQAKKKEPEKPQNKPASAPPAKSPINDKGETQMMTPSALYGHEFAKG